ncbi:HdeA/HdeB family chaperone [Robbsia sp. Bb-Pol-6]|uniref:HdeA/HdeB family chaperone n=1 Tax=Robbsia betulipollinis TaxID=2981849 RepID=A0ABT3ZJI5_9BURK|nr:HdeA/HdeB family chaperone [Robbsia betulipollinis]MCY0386684.1 HdeA/HdeB family chaperone [Robbsia betulipollinis]
MKRLTAALLPCILLAFTNASFAATPMEVTPSKMKCEDFVAMGSAYQPAMIYWVVGVDKLGVRETDRLVVDTVQPVADVIAECKKTPDAMFMGKVREMVKAKKLPFLKTYAHN